MVSVIPLGTLERTDIKSAWPREDTNFTQWLAAEGNISILSDALGVPIEVTHTEKYVGPYRADIVGRTNDDDIVVVENQYGRTNHDHLGKLLTYAADLDAKYVVWIAEEFTEQHRNAVDWINEHVAEGLSVFAIQVELWKIADSPPAPRFNLVAQPNDWTRTVRAAERAQADRAGSASAETYTRYWQAMMDIVTATSDAPRPQKFRPGSYYQLFAFAQSGAWLSACASLRDRVVWAEAVFASESAVARFHALMARSDEIDRAVGLSLKWDHIETRKQQKVIWQIEGDPNDEHDWPRQHADLVKALIGLSTTLESSQATP